MSTIPSQVEINFNKIHQRSNSSSSTSSYRIPSGNSCIPRTVEMPSLPPTSTHHQHQQMPSSSSHAHIAKKYIEKFDLVHIYLVLPLVKVNLVKLNLVGEKMVNIPAKLPLN